MQGLTLAVQASTFMNSGGPAVVWSPAVPGRLVGCAVQGRPNVAERFYSSCDFSHMTGDTPPRMLAYIAPVAAADSDARNAASSGTAGVELQGDAAIGADMPPVVVHSQRNSSNDTHAMRLSVYVPPEAFAIALTISEVRTKLSDAMMHMLKRSTLIQEPDFFYACHLTPQTMT